MTIKQIINLVTIILLVFTSVTSLYLYNTSVKQQDNIQYLRHNLIVSDSKISDMTFSVKELNGFLKDKDSKHKIEIDSILKNHNVKIKNLIKYQKITVANIDKDTTTVVTAAITIKNDSTYQIKFKDDRKCVKIEGYLLSKDSTTAVFITEIENNNNIYITKSYVKTFWDKLFFRKGKEVIKATSDCGEIRINEININR